MNNNLVFTYLSNLSYNLRLFSTLPKKTGFNLSQCYRILGVPPSCSDAELRLAYISLVKQLHPDSSNENNKNDFQNVQHAYESVMIARKDDSIEYDDSKEEGKIEFDIKHTAPQHRQYLEYGGVGSGTPGQRQRQYQQIRVQQALENVTEHRIDQAKLKSQLNNQSESQIIQQDNLKSAKKIQTRSFIDRLVEDLIQESISKGEFDDLPGKGKPLPDRGSDVNPFVDLATHNLNRVLIQNGYVPEWAVQDKEIRECWEYAKKQLMLTRRRLGPYPFESMSEHKLWHQEQLVFNKRVEEINRMVDRFNLVAPTLRQQIAHFSFDKFPDKILQDSSLVYTMDELPHDSPSYYGFTSGSQGISISDIANAFSSFWKELKSMKRGK